ncbi:hypothetical protein G7K_3069-t1 [Saitoella complicata NRRL Y-17804]|uniref:Probable glycerol kinase n=2 Tax=Saitoella complicata (strain BCRC 22490 / CBS 7301 / JCM 7358 / NBRC 10748 / NRRL Y-17804) TaxID=698492 RepID=A0A0E9NGW4_SAICN|nr:hypothetical protein G7K_3069-t1 [Saitoella complicata NRRL Y-17804]
MSVSPAVNLSRNSSLRSEFGERRTSSTPNTRRPSLRSTPSRRNSAMLEGDSPEEVFVGAIDQGTTSTRFIIFDRNGQPQAQHQVEFEQIYPKPGWIEHDPEEIRSSVSTVLSKATKNFLDQGRRMRQLQAVGITNQRETTVVWDAETGRPLYNAIVWADTRTTETVQQLKRRPGSDKIFELCGLPITTYFSAVKLRWILDHVEDAREAYNEGALMFGTIDSWLIWNFTGGINGGIHVTDPTNASRTMLMNIRTLQWDQELIDFFDLGKVILPEILSSSEVYGKMSTGPLAGIPISGCLGDQSSALVGQQAFNPGDAKNTYGTGCFLLYNTGETPVLSKNGLLTTVGYKFGDKKPVYALEGSIAVAGSSIKWLRDGLGLIKESSEISDLAASVEDAGGVIFVPAFSGLFAPYWRDDVRGTMLGITHYTTKAHICRATLEAICFQAKAILDAMNKDSGTPLKVLKVDGGVTNSDTCMQIQSDTIGLRVERPAMRETTALGAAIAAGFAVGVWSDFSELSSINQEGKDIFEPAIEESVRDERFGLWERAVRQSCGWLKRDEVEELKDGVEQMTLVQAEEKAENA